MKLDKPTIFCSTPRSGSAFVSKCIALQNPEFAYFNEPHQFGPEKINEFKTNENNLKIVKIHSTHMNLACYSHLINYDIIKIKRRNAIDQLASIYLSSLARKYVYTNENEFSQFNEHIEIKNELITKSVYGYCYAIDAQNRIESKLDLFYEDFYQLDQADVGYLKTKKPDNYELLKTVIKSNIKEMLSRDSMSLSYRNILCNIS